MPSASTAAIPLPPSRLPLRPAALLILAPFIGVGALATAVQSGSQAELAPPPATSGAAAPVANETYRWRPVAVGAGGFITGLAFDRTGETRLARTDTYGAYIWRDDRWHQLVSTASMPREDHHQNGAAEGVYEIAVAPSDPQRMVMVTNGHVYHSSDRGNRWTRAQSGPFPLANDPNGPFRLYGPFMTISPRDPRLVLLGTPTAGLLRSTDGGANWTPVAGVAASLAVGKAARDPAVGRRSPGALIWFAPSSAGARPAVWVMAQGSGMMISRDDGAGFAPLPNAGATAPKLLRRGSFLSDGAFIGVDSEGKSVWLYRDGRWTDLVAGGAIPARPYAAVAADPRGATVYVFDEGGRGARSLDGGRSWWRFAHRSAAGDKDPPWLRVSNQSYFATADVQYDPVTPGRLWVGAGTGVYYADPALGGIAIRWISQARGIEQLVTNDVVQPPGGAPAFAAWDFGVRVMSDLDRFSTGYGPRERVVIAAQQVAWTPANPRFLVTNASDTRMNCCSEDGQSVLAGYSEDGGKSWTRFATLPQPPGTRADDPWKMAFGTIAVSASDTDNIVWEPAFNRSPFFTRDRGKSWTRVSLPGETLPNTGSFDGFWRQRKTLAADRVKGGVFYLVHSGEGANAALQGLWRTEDGGGRWTRVFQGEIAPSSQHAAKLRVVPGKAGHLFFTSAVAEGADTRLRRSTDGGRTWRALDEIDHVDDIAFGKAARGAGYPALYISGRVRGRYGIWRSVDDGADWQQLVDYPLGTLDQVTVIEADKDIFGRVYLGYKGSGWIYGQPAPCRPAPLRGGDREQCAALR